MKPRSSVEHMTPDDWALLGEYVKSLPFGQRGSQKVATKFDVPPASVREYCAMMKIPQSKQQAVEYFLEKPESFGMTRKQIALTLGCTSHIVCRVMSTKIYPKHDISTGYVDYMRVMYVYESKKKILGKCIYCGHERDMLTSEIEYRPNSPWCSCKSAKEHHDTKRKQATQKKYRARHYWRPSGEVKAKQAYHHWMTSQDTLRKSAELYHTTTKLVHRYRTLNDLPHKYALPANCE